MPSGIAAFASPHLELIDGAGDNARLYLGLNLAFFSSSASLWAVFHACPGNVHASACWTILVKGSNDTVQRERMYEYGCFGVWPLAGQLQRYISNGAERATPRLCQDPCHECFFKAWGD